MNNQEQTINGNINDLNVSDTEQSEIKGGPKRIFIGDVKGGMLLPAVQKVR
jgi:hypothetical protein